MKKKNKTTMITFIVIAVVVLAVVNILVFQAYSGESSVELEGNVIVADDQNSEAMELEEKLPQTHEIRSSRLGFDPSELRIERGDSVTWINEDVFDFDVIIGLRTKELGSERLFIGDTYTNTFDEEGDFEYVSVVTEAVGRVVVQ